MHHPGGCFFRFWPIECGQRESLPRKRWWLLFLLIVVFPLVVFDGGDLFVWVGYPRVILVIVFMATYTIVAMVPLGFCVISIEAVKFW